jgi:hypothetical protein
VTRALIVGALLFAVALATGMQVPAARRRAGRPGAPRASARTSPASLVAAGRGLPHAHHPGRPAMQMPVFVVLFLAPVFVPLALVGGWVHAVAQVNPFTALLEGGRDLISGQSFPAGVALRDRAGAAARVLGLGRARAAPRRARRVAAHRGGTHGACPHRIHSSHEQIAPSAPCSRVRGSARRSRRHETKRQPTCVGRAPVNVLPHDRTFSTPTATDARPGRGLTERIDYIAGLGRRAACG